MCTIIVKINFILIEKSKLPADLAEDKGVPYIFRDSTCTFEMKGHKLRIVI